MSVQMFSTVLLMAFLMSTQVSFSQTGEEFSGDFKSWANVKNRFGAVGDGKNDDTKALQTALDSLSVQPKNFNVSRSGFTTIYLPSGKYRITRTLKLKGKIGVNFIGEDPRTTSIVWDGLEGQTILWANGASYFKISRITFNANGKNSIVGIGLKWRNKWNDEVSQSYAPLNIEISDCNFIGKMLHGIDGGTYGGEGGTGTGANDSEVTIQRCSFIECSKAGINITGFNALDYWIWDCRFIKCGFGIANAHGNYHAYRCFFEGSTETDFLNDNGYYTSVRGCYSLNAARFSVDQGASCNPFKRIFQGNYVRSKLGNEIHFPHVGKPVFLDNTFYQPFKGGSENVLYYKTWCPGIYEVLSIGNRYPLAEPFQITSSPKKIFSINDVNSFKGQPAISKEQFLASQDPLPSKQNRKIFEVPVNATTEVIQSLINQASAMKGSKSIVHFGFGKYVLNRQLKIPAGSDLQLIGDGLLYSSILTKSPNFPAQTALLKVIGPTNIVIRDLQLGEHDGIAGNVNAIEFENVDQPGSTAFLDQLHSAATIAVELAGLDYLYVQKTNSFFSNGNLVSGGKLVAQGKGTAGLYCYGGQFADLTIRGNGRFIAKDCWWEGPSKKPLDLAGSGSITLDGVMIAPIASDSTNIIVINKFDGKISIMNGYIQGGISVSPENPGLSLLLWNLHFYHAMNPTRFISARSNFKGAFLGLSTQCFQTGDPNCGQILSKEDKVSRIANEESFLLDMVAQDRAAIPIRYKGSQPGESSIFLSRVSIGNLDTAVRFLK